MSSRSRAKWGCRAGGRIEPHFGGFACPIDRNPTRPTTGPGCSRTAARCFARLRTALGGDRGRSQNSYSGGGASGLVNAHFGSPQCKQRFVMSMLSRLPGVVKHQSFIDVIANGRAQRGQCQQPNRQPVAAAVPSHTAPSMMTIDSRSGRPSTASNRTASGPMPKAMQRAHHRRRRYCRQCAA